MLVLSLIVTMRTYLLLFAFFVVSPLFSQETDSIYTYVDQSAEFPGGNHEMLRWLHDNFSIPDSLFLEEPPSSMYFSFVVETDGRLTQIRVKKSFNPEVDRYLAGMIKSMPRWNPAVHQGKTVRSQYNLPITCIKYQ